MRSARLDRRGLMLRSAVAILAAGCGRIGFEPGAGGGSADPDSGNIAACTSCPVFAAAGSFVKPGGAAMATQTIAHGMGTTPKALLLFTTGNAQTPFAADYRSAFGITDELRDSRSNGASSVAGAPVTITRRAIVDAALSVIDTTETTIAEARVIGWDASTITLSWDINSAQTQVVEFLALGGSGVSSKVLRWTAPAGPTTMSVAGSGFKPDLVLHAHAGHGFILPPPAIELDAALGLGVMDAAGGQWANAATSIDNSGMADTQRGQKPGVAFYAFHGDLSVTKEATLISMDANGFTMQFSIANMYASQMSSLALAGVRTHVACAAKSTAAAPAVQSVEIGFTPVAVLFSSVSDAPSPVPIPNARWSVGFATAAGAGTAAFSDEDTAMTSTVVHGAAPAALIKVDNSLGTIDARASLVSLDPTGFTLSWNPNDAVATEFCFIAFGSP